MKNILKNYLNFNINKKSILPYILGTLAIIIWGYNGYQVFSGIFSADDNTVIEIPDWKPQIIAADSQFVKQAFIYEAKYRDPFKDWLRTSTKSKKKIIKKPKAKSTPLPILPKLRLTGILQDSSGPLAMIETLDKKMYFIHINEEINGVKIIMIDEKGIKCRFGKVEYRVELKP